MTQDEAIAIMNAHGQICVECGHPVLDPDGGLCGGCGNDNWLEPEDYYRWDLGRQWYSVQLRKLLKNVEGKSA